MNIKNDKALSRDRRHINSYLFTSLLLIALIPSTPFSSSANADERHQEIGVTHAVLSAQVLEQITSIQKEKDSWTPVQRKISSKLLLEIKKRLNQPIMAGVSEVRSAIAIDAAGLTLVDIKADVSTNLLLRIQNLGGQVINSFARYKAIRALVPVIQLETLAEEASIISIRPADKAMVHKDNTSQGVTAHRADIARTTYGVDGTGVRVGVLSDSVDSLVGLQASGDLPAGVTVLPGQSGNPGSSEGTAMLEIVYDVAPGADLYFATAFAGQAQFAQNIIDLQAAGCDVIVDDVSYLSEPVFQDGIIAQAAETVVASGAVYFSAAGNGGNFNAGTSGVWEGDFVPVTAPTPLSGETAHDFGGGQSYNTITKDSPYGFTLQWSDASGASGNDYDLYLLNSTLTAILDSSIDVQDGNDDPFEMISSSSANDTGKTLVIVRKPGDAPRFLHLNANRGEFGISTDGQICGHSGALSVLSVAAVYAGGGVVFTGGESVETFSSDGPRRVFYTADATPITPGNFSSTGGELRMKPDIAAADGVNCATPEFPLFNGTSAAAPHAAAIAALMIENGLTTPSQIQQAMINSTWDIEAAGFDRDSGYGIVDALAAVGYNVSPPRLQAIATSISQINLLWSKNSSNDNVLIAYNMNGVFGTPSDGTSYSAGNMIGAATVLYAGSATNYSHACLSADTMYYYRAWSVNGDTEYSYGASANASTPIPPGTIHGSKWHDVNTNTVWDAGEPGLPGWKIYSDLNGNKQWDVDEPFDVTDANGDFALVVESGQHFVAEELKAYWEQTYPSESTGTGKLTFRQVLKDGVGGVDGLNEARSVTVSPEGGNVYAAGTSDDAVAVFSRNPSSGELTYVQMLRDGVGDVSGLDGACSVSVSPEGAHVYAAGRYDDAVVVFSRNSSNGQLTYVQMLEDGTDGVDGLNGIWSVTVSPDGRHVYAASIYDDSVVVFSRHPSSGQLTFVQMLRDGVGGVDGLDGAKSVAVSPDGGHVYATSIYDDSVVVFSRHPSSGQLTYVQMLKDGVGGVDGLDGVWSVTVSPDGRHVYTASYNDDAVTVFSRNPFSGQLTYIQMLKDGGDGVDGLNGAQSVTVSPEGGALYAAGGDDDAVVVFSRNPSSGQLTYVQMLKDGTDGVDGLDWTWSVTVSPDGGHVYAAGASDDAVAVFSSDDAASGMHQVTIDPLQIVTNINFGNVLMVVDTDADGIPDWWETLYFGSLSSCFATNDWDLDGHNNLQEYICGTDPTNSASCFGITKYAPLADLDYFVIEWDSHSGRVYSALWSTNLMNSFQPLETDIEYPRNSCTDTLHSAKDACFYQVEVQLQ